MLNVILYTMIIKITWDLLPVDSTIAQRESATHDGKPWKKELSKFPAPYANNSLGNVNPHETNKDSFIKCWNLLD